VKNKKKVTKNGGEFFDDMKSEFWKKPEQGKFIL
jgi:hypothetical protein